MTPETVATEALRILRERGWIKGEFWGKRGSCCLSGAIISAGHGRFGLSRQRRQAASECAARARNLVGPLIPFNDNPATQFDDVALVLKRVANGEGVAK